MVSNRARCFRDGILTALLGPISSATVFGQHFVILNGEDDIFSISDYIY